MLDQDPDRRYPSIARVMEEIDAINRASEFLATMNQFQARLNTIYGTANANRNPDLLFERFLLHVALVKRVIADGSPSPQLAKAAIAQAFAWGFGYAQTVLGIQASRVIAGKYQDGCPYCKGSPCECGDEKEGPEAEWVDFGPVDANIRELQNTLHCIYGVKNGPMGIAVLADKCVQEAIELLEVRLKMAASPESRSRMLGELADVFARLFAVASHLELDVAAALNSSYPGYCKKCQQEICNCPMETADLTYRHPGYLR